MDGKMKILFLILTLLFSNEATAQCAIPAPAEGWVCQDGGWLPPGHPSIRSAAGTTPTTQSANPFRAPIYLDPIREINTEGIYMTEKEFQEAAWSGTTLPAKNIWFDPPIRLRDIATLRGISGRTRLIPLTQKPGPLFIIEGHLALVWRQVLENLFIFCTSREQTGLVINSHKMTLNYMTIAGCDEGINFGFAVNIAVRDSLISDNRIGVYVMGYGPTGVSGPNSVTTLRFSGTRFVANTSVGLKIGHGIGIVLDDSTIIEGNPGIGLLIAPTFPGAYVSVLLRDVWFEGNGQHIVDPLHIVRSEGFTGGH